MKHDINILALVKGVERYVFMYDDQHTGEALRTLGKFASDTELSFNWYDAAVLSKRMRESQQVPSSGPVSKERAVWEARR